MLAHLGTQPLHKGFSCVANLVAHFDLLGWTFA